MDTTTHATLAGWADFYLITGTAAAALTGLQFVVQTLLASDAHRPVSGGDPEAGTDAFGTPTVVHFTLALVLSAVLCMPWPGYGGLRIALGVIGVGALAYSAVVMRRARRQRSYVPVFEDWAWHVILPAGAYAAVLAAGVLLGRGAEGPLFALAAATLLLLCVGIHNAWDTVTWLTFSAWRSATRQREHAATRAPEREAAPKERAERAAAPTQQPERESTPPRRNDRGRRPRRRR